MKNLPKLYKGTVSASNNRKVFYSKNDCLLEENKNNTSLVNLDDLFKNNKYGYSEEIKIVTNKKEYVTRLVKKINDTVLTIDNELIKVEDIKKIEKN